MLKTYKCEICESKNIEPVRLLYKKTEHNFCVKCWEKYFRPMINIVFDLLKERNR